jgi:RNA polymerase sigma-70 factor (ECF subfamily)
LTYKHDELLDHLPSLRRYAMSITRSEDAAGDLVQETVVRALTNAHQFEVGTNLRAWLFTIMRNANYTTHRRRAREVEDVDDVHASRLATPAAQLDHCDLLDARARMVRLSPSPRGALVVVAALGCTYGEAAVVLGVNVGTVKSRVSRARAELVQMMDT